MIAVEIPEAEWIALVEFIEAQRHLPYGIEAAVRAAKPTRELRVVTLSSPQAVRALIDVITGYAQAWDVEWAVPLNRILPRLYRALDGA